MADNDGNQNSGGQGDNKGGSNAAGDFVPKAEFEKVSASVTKMQQDLEDARLEMMSPEYLEFLSSKSQKKEEPKKEAPPVSDDEFSKMTPKQIYERAKADTLAESKKAIDEMKKLDETRTKETIQKEIKQFSVEHDDFEDFRPTMYGLSLDPKNKDLSLAQLYAKAKEQVKRISGVPSEEERKKSNKTKGEKPGGASMTYKREDKKIDANQAADEAWEEVVGDSGLPGT